MVKTLKKRLTIQIPEKVTVDLQGRKVTVKGGLGTVSRDLGYFPCEIKKVGNKRLLIQSHFSRKADNASLKSNATHIQNMIDGVSKGFKYDMQFVSAHFPIGLTTSDDDKTVEIRNFIGMKAPRIITMLGETTVHLNTKDSIYLKGTNIEDVGQSAASIHQACLIRGKDLRKFLDGCYVSNKGNILDE